MYCEGVMPKVAPTSSRQLPKHALVPTICMPSSGEKFIVSLYVDLNYQATTRII